MSASDIKQLLLHVCCAPCSGGIIKTLLKEGIRPTVYFYNPNIFPMEEYERRKASVVTFLNKHNVPFIDADYEPEVWLKEVQGLELEPERGRRCSVCFEMRLMKTALYAHQHGFTHFATTNGISRWKNFEQVTSAGLRAASHFPGLTYWPRNWRLKGGQAQMLEIAKEEHFYKQSYCGCRFSFESAPKNVQTLRYY